MTKGAETAAVRLRTREWGPGGPEPRGSTAPRTPRPQAPGAQSLDAVFCGFSPPARGPSMRQPRGTVRACGGLPRPSLCPGDQQAFDAHHVTARTAEPLHRCPRPCPARDRGARAGTVLNTAQPATPAGLTGRKMLRGRAPGSGRSSLRLGREQDVELGTGCGRPTQGPRDWRATHRLRGGLRRAGCSQRLHAPGLSRRLELAREGWLSAAGLGRGHRPSLSAEASPAPPGVTAVQPAGPVLGSGPGGRPTRRASFSRDDGSCPDGAVQRWDPVEVTGHESGRSGNYEARGLRTPPRGAAPGSGLNQPTSKHR